MNWTKKNYISINNTQFYRFNSKLIHIVIIIISWKNSKDHFFSWFYMKILTKNTLFKHFRGTGIFLFFCFHSEINKICRNFCLYISFFCLKILPIFFFAFKPELISQNYNKPFLNSINSEKKCLSYSRQINFS